MTDWYMYARQGASMFPNARRRPSMLRQCVHACTVAICLITTIFLVARLDELDGFAFWASLIAAGMTNTVVTNYIVSRPKSSARESRT